MIEAYVHDARDAYGGVRLWIAPSRFVMEKAEWLGVARERLRLLSHGVEAEVAAPGAEKAPLDRAGLSAGSSFALFAARLTLEKGVRLLPGIAASIAPTPLIVAGEGPLESWLSGTGAANLRCVGHLAPPVLAALRARAAAVVVPSLFQETYGYTPAEALLDARPVVATRIGALPELVEHEVTGLSAPPGDAAALGALVRRALDDPAAAGWGLAGAERVRAMGDPRRHVEGLLAIYAEAIGRAA